MFTEGYVFFFQEPCGRKGFSVFPVHHLHDFWLEAQPAEFLGAFSWHAQSGSSESKQRFDVLDLREIFLQESLFLTHVDQDQVCVKSFDMHPPTPKKNLAKVDKQHCLG